MALTLTPQFLDRPVYTLTVRELLELNKLTEEATAAKEPETKSIELTSIDALAKFLDVSATTAQKIKNSGKIPYTQFGKKVWFDGAKVKAALANRK